MTSHPIDVLEAADQLDGDDRTWLERVALAIPPFLDDGHGMFAYRFDATRPLSEWLDTMITFGLDREPVIATMNMFANPSGGQLLEEISRTTPEPLNQSGFERGLAAGYDLRVNPSWASTLAHYGAIDTAL